MTNTLPLSSAIAIACILITTTAASADAEPPKLTGHELIRIEGRVPPAVLPEPKNWTASKAPPYSDRAILSDAWTKAWLLLDIDATGTVTRFKFLKRPGYDLEAIATSEVWRLAFEPARDEHDRPMATLVVWQIEWPSARWLVLFNGTRSAMPKKGVGRRGRRQDAGVPCAGSGPWRMDSVWKGYKDCSEPDLSRAAKEAWIERTR